MIEKKIMIEKEIMIESIDLQENKEKRRHLILIQTQISESSI